MDSLALEIMFDDLIEEERKKGFSFEDIEEAILMSLQGSLQDAMDEEESKKGV